MNTRKYTHHSCTGRGGGLGEGPRHHKRRSHRKQGDAALTAMLNTKQPSSIEVLQQQLQELGQAVERAGPHALKHRPSAPGAMDPILQASARVWVAFWFVVAVMCYGCVHWKPWWCGCSTCRSIQAQALLLYSYKLIL